MLIYAARCWAYTYLLDLNVWYVLFLEPSHGITYALMWSCSVREGARMAPPGRKSEMMAYVSGMYVYAGQASGSLIGGFLFHHFGGDFMYRTGGTTAGVWSLLYFSISLCLRRRKSKRSLSYDALED